MVGDKTVGDKTVVDIFNPIVTGREGDHSAENQELYSAEETQIPEIEDKFSLPYNQSLLSSTQDSLSKPCHVDEQIRILLAPPRFLPEREASAERSQIYHSGGDGLMSSSSQSLNFFGPGKPVAWHSHQKRMGQDDFSEREQPADVLRGNGSVFRDANPANVAKSLLEGNRDHLLTQARTELMKQEHKVESLNIFISELKQQAYAQRLDLENAHQRRDSDPKYARNERNEESSRITS